MLHAREKTSQAIINALVESPNPLKVQEILSWVQQNTSLNDLDKSKINSLLYGELKGRVQRDNNYRWSLIGAANNMVNQETPKGDTLNCPDCGAEMVIRTAGKGRNVGNRFYGCTNYPKCKGTRSLEDTDPIVQVESSMNRRDFPRRISLQQGKLNRQQLFIESVALPRTAIRYLSQVPLDLAYQRALSQWKLDLPIPSTQSDTTFPASWVHVAEKILMRGRLVPISEELQNEFTSIIDFDGLDQVGGEEWENAAKSVSLIDSNYPDDPRSFDSDEEQTFFNDLIEDQGSHLHRWLNQQVSLGGLTGSSEDQLSEQRVDFLLAHPNGLEIVIEIDGLQHQAHEVADRSRDTSLIDAGFEVVRISAENVRNGRYDDLTELWDKLKNVDSIECSVLEPVDKLLLLCKRAHQLQVALIKALALRLIDSTRSLEIKVAVVLSDDTGPYQDFVYAAIEDLNKLTADLSAVYTPEISPITFDLSELNEADLVVDFAGQDGEEIAESIIYIRDFYVPVTLSNTISAPAVPGHTLTPDKEIFDRLLQRIFAHDTFKEGQFEAIKRVLQFKDAIVLLPTGSGKSVAFQMASFLMPGTCIVIDPILSLIDDQIDNLRSDGIDRVTQITSAFSGDERRLYTELFSQGEYLFCYIAPERLQDANFRESLQSLTMHMPVSLVAIDEAHCVSEWGHDFRPAYLNIARTCREYCRSGDVVPPIMALTATASRSVLKDIQRELEIQDYDALITPSTFDRKELNFEAVKCRSEEKNARLRGLMQALPQRFGQNGSTFFSKREGETMSGLIFCPHANGNFGVVDIARDLSNGLGLAVPYYSGGKPTRDSSGNWDKKKRENASSFKRNQSVVMACTKAFGMGIDKPNVRYTVHYCLPPSIESFYQEAGRAGRDQKIAYCSMLFSNDDPTRTARLLDPNTSLEEVKELANVKRTEADDITRALWFHTNSYGGQEEDFLNLCDVLDEIGNIRSTRTVNLTYTPGDRDKDKLKKEKAVHRLLTIGVVEDYTINYSSREFSIRLAHPDPQNVLKSLQQYIAAYNRERAQVAVEELRPALRAQVSYEDFAREAGKQLITFIYDVVERSRRHALSEMLLACTNDPSNEGLRKRILNYLGTSSFTEDISQVIDGDRGGLSSALSIVGEIRSSIDANQVRGESGRALEGYPDHPGLRLLRGISEAICADPDEEIIAGHIEVCIESASSRYGVDTGYVSEMVIKAAGIVNDIRPELGKVVIRALLNAAPEKRMTARSLIQEFHEQEELAEPAIAYLIKEINESVDHLLRS